jgi:hypothetical protein
MDDCRRKCISKKLTSILLIRVTHRRKCSSNSYRSKYIINTITSQDFNAIERILKSDGMFENMFKSTDTSPVYQLKKHYLRCIKVLSDQVEMCETVLEKY